MVSSSVSRESFRLVVNLSVFTSERTLNSVVRSTIRTGHHYDVTPSMATTLQNSVIVTCIPSRCFVSKPIKLNARGRFTGVIKVWNLYLLFSTLNLVISYDDTPTNFFLK